MTVFRIADEKLPLSESFGTNRRAFPKRLRVRNICNINNIFELSTELTGNQDKQECCNSANDIVIFYLTSAVKLRAHILILINLRVPSILLDKVILEFSDSRGGDSRP